MRSPLTGLTACRPRKTPVLGRSADCRSMSVSLRTLVRYSASASRCSGAQISSASGESAATTKNVAPYSVSGRVVTVFTTRPDTLYGATFFVVAADSPLAEEICAPEQREALAEYLTKVRKLTDIERQSADRPKTGVFLGRHAVNPVNGERIPVWAADYVLTDYGTGAIMGVPAHDQRDLDFARAHKLPIRMVVDTGEADPAVSGIATHGD